MSFVGVFILFFKPGDRNDFVVGSGDSSRTGRMVIRGG